MISRSVSVGSSTNQCNFLQNRSLALYVSLFMPQNAFHAMRQTKRNRIIKTSLGASLEYHHRINLQHLGRDASSCYLDETFKIFGATRQFMKRVTPRRLLIMKDISQASCHRGAIMARERCGWTAFRGIITRGAFITHYRKARPLWTLCGWIISLRLTTRRSSSGWES